jgi:hypothetical protein
LILAYCFFTLALVMRSFLILVTVDAGLTHAGNDLEKGEVPFRRQAPSGRFSGPTRKPCLAFFGFLESSAVEDAPASTAASSSRERLEGMVRLEMVVSGCSVSQPRCGSSIEAELFFGCDKRR